MRRRRLIWRDGDFVGVDLGLELRIVLAAADEIARHGCQIRNVATTARR
jgi:hypothetical protein